MKDAESSFLEPVTKYISQDYITLNKDWSVDESLKALREKNPTSKVLYFYVVNEQNQLIGVVPSRKLLTSPLNAIISEIMIPKVIAIPDSFTLIEACEMFVLYKYLAFPVVDQGNKLLGIVDVTLFTERVSDLIEKGHADELFESIGFRIHQVKTASLAKSVWVRFPWLIPTLVSGILCALLASLFGKTISQFIILAFFFPLILAIGESVSIQTMTMFLHLVRYSKISLKWYLSSVFKETFICLCLGILLGLSAFLISGLWPTQASESLAIGLSIAFAAVVAGFWGISIPTITHKISQDPKLASGPLVLALTDIFTTLGYCLLASLLLV
jgi:magnesium transporter